MLSRNETVVWRRLERLEDTVEKLEIRYQTLADLMQLWSGRERARLKEKADTRKLSSFERGVKLGDREARLKEEAENARR